MPRNNVTKKHGKSKIKISDKREAAMRRIMDSYNEDFDVKMSVIQELIPLGLKAVAEELKGEVLRLAGEKYSRGGNNARWGRQNGSVYLRDQKIPIMVPRVLWNSLPVSVSPSFLASMMPQAWPLIKST